jgi:hypothetical protein
MRKKAELKAAEGKRMELVEEKQHLPCIAASGSETCLLGDALFEICIYPEGGVRRDACKSIGKYLPGLAHRILRDQVTSVRCETKSRC